MNIGDIFSSRLSSLKVKVVEILDDKRVKVKCYEPDGHTFTQRVLKETLLGSGFKEESEYDKQKSKLSL